MTVSHSSQTSLTAPGEVASLQIAPSLLYSLRDRLTDYLWVRPYFGGGVTFVRDSLRNITPGVTDSTKRGFGWQGFGGAEFTFPSVPKFTLSADVRLLLAPRVIHRFRTRPDRHLGLGSLVREIAPAFLIAAASRPTRGERGGGIPAQFSVPHRPSVTGHVVVQLGAQDAQPGSVSMMSCTNCLSPRSSERARRDGP